MSGPRASEEPRATENPSEAAPPSPPAPGFFRRVDWPNLAAFVAVLGVVGYGLWHAIDDVDDDVNRLGDRMDREVQGIRGDIGAVQGDVKDLAGEVQFIKGRLAGTKHQSDEDPP